MQEGRFSPGTVVDTDEQRGKAKPEKFGNTSEHSFIDNGDVHGKKCPGYLDKGWYIQLAKTRLAQFGVM